MNVGSLKNIVLQDVDDTVDGNVLLGWLNRGYEYLQQFVILPELETTQSLSFTDGVADLPSDFVHLVELLIDGVAYRTQIDYEQRNEYSDESNPYVFYLWGSEIGVLPAQTTTGTLAYVKQDAQFTDDADVPKCLAVFQPLIAEYAKGLYREQNGQFAKAVAHFTNVDNAIERLIGKLNKRIRRQSVAWTDIRARYPNYP
uniref:Uncharacterized protein n=1 Tax=Eiseniibacteriota bacterium TaxID=2212470 RepID=A0A832I364_UNCEI